ncbi:MAG: hypothetical protein AAGJ93_13760, partial [Bacteroidota bacterium]
SLSYQYTAADQQGYLEKKITGLRTQLSSYTEGLVTAQREGNQEKIKGYQHLQDYVGMQLDRAKRELDHLQSQQETTHALERS